MPMLLSSIGGDQIKERAPECGARGRCLYCERLGQVSDNQEDVVGRLFLLLKVPLPCYPLGGPRTSCCGVRETHCEALTLKSIKLRHRTAKAFV